MFDIQLSVEIQFLKRKSPILSSWTLDPALRVASLRVIPDSHSVPATCSEMALCPTAFLCLQRPDQSPDPLDSTENGQKMWA